MVDVNPDIMVGKPQCVGYFIPLEKLKNAIEQHARADEMPVVVEVDKASIGKGFFAPTEDCVAIYHKEHRRDYNSIVLIQRKQGKFSYLSIYLGGRSKNFVNTQMPTNNAFGRHIVRSAKAAYQNEDLYYGIMLDIVAEAVGSIPNMESSSPDTSYTNYQPVHQEPPKTTTYTSKPNNQNRSANNGTNRAFSANNTYHTTTPTSKNGQSNYTKKATESNSQVSKEEPSSLFGRLKQLKEEEQYDYLKKVTGCNFKVLREKHPELFSIFKYNPIHCNSGYNINDYISGYVVVKKALDYLNKKYTSDKLSLYVNGCDKIKYSLSMFKSLYNTQQINENNVVAFFDNGGKDGFVLTNNCLYIHNFWSKACTVNLTGIQKIYEKNGMVYISYPAGYPSEIEIQIQKFKPGAQQMVCFLNYCISMILAKRYWEIYGEDEHRQNLYAFDNVGNGNYRILNDKKEYVFFECLYCGHKYRAKKGKGMLEITCVDCGNKLRKKV